MKTQKIVTLSGISLLLNACMNQYTIRTLPSPQTIDGRVGSPLITAQTNTTTPVSTQSVPVQTVPVQTEFEPMQPAVVNPTKPIATPAVSSHNHTPMKRMNYDLSQNEINDLELKIMHRHINLKKANQPTIPHQTIADPMPPVYRHHKKESFVCQNGLEIVIQPKDKNTILLAAPNAKQKAVPLRLSGRRFIGRQVLFQRPAEWHRSQASQARLRFTYTDNQVYETTCSLKK